MLFTENNDGPQKSEKTEKLWDRSVDRKERLAQTYMVIYGLLFSIGQLGGQLGYFPVQSKIISLFFPFLVAILVYDTLLSRITYDGMFDDSPWYTLSLLIMEFCAIVASYCFSYAVISYMVVFGSGEYLFGFWTMVLLLTSVVLSSLSAALFTGYLWLRDWLWSRSFH